MQPCGSVFNFTLAELVFAQCTEAQRVCQNLPVKHIPGEMPLMLAQLSGTKWPSIHDCCVHVLGQWDELKLDFQLCKEAKRWYDAEVLYQMYFDAMNKLHLQFLMPILHQFSRVNKLFQLETGNAFKMLDCRQSFCTLVWRVITLEATKQVQNRFYSKCQYFEIHGIIQPIGDYHITNHS